MSSLLIIQASYLDDSHFVNMLILLEELRSYQEASKDAQWRVAMIEEIKSTYNNITY